MSLFDAKGRNQAIDCLNRSSFLAETPKILRRGNGQLLSRHIEQLKFKELRPGLAEFVVASEPLQGLAQDQIRQSEPSFTRLSVKPFRFRIAGATEVINPNGCV